MPGSVKGRVMLNRARVHTPPLDREGVCAWCGLTVFGPAEGEAVVWCPRCASDEIDWIAPPPVPPAPPKSAERLRLDENALRITAMNLQGAKVHGRH